ncbi:1-acylglycerol-3-phosphate O-acyltransferase [Handroanthus impetiginosus]|uniref:1-acylglycerol-3-phosphate O-acyltransferase n=1 Tax=Handroanthus impetiginosus TaxID=429701 RepID=A0A2G9HR32_9LAMI|nr:1-acylglycerol-3-phosphate O-acyltransferase [Handroanthus impetiginosus]
MAIAPAIVIVPLGVLFFISGLVVNLIQAVCYVTIRPISKNTYRRINREVAELLWLELVWLIDWWAGVKIELYTDSETFKLMGKEHALVISNHRSDIDWLVGWVLAQRSGCLGSTLAVMKKSSKLLPHRSRLGALQGFVTAVSHMRSFVPAIYDVTVAIPKTSPAPTMLRLFKGQSSVIHVHLKRHLMKDLPETDDADKLLDKHIAEGSFGEQLQDTGRPVKSLLVVTSWAILLLLGLLKVFQWFSLFSSWKGISFLAIALAIVTILMQILIQFSQSERSTPAKVAPSKAKSRGESSTTRVDKQQ